MRSETKTAGMFETTSNEAKDYRGWSIGAGIASLVLGTAPMIYNSMATIASVTFFGALLMFGGAVVIVNTFQVQTRSLARVVVTREGRRRIRREAFWRESTIRRS
jgi:uncharacterized membrane protein HdeD (DUF308 family)